MDVASARAAIPRVHVRARSGVRGLVRRSRTDVRTPRLIHDGDDERAGRDADAHVRELPGSGGRVRRLARQARFPLPLLDRCRPRARRTSRAPRVAARAETAPAVTADALVMTVPRSRPA